MIVTLLGCVVFGLGAQFGPLNVPVFVLPSAVGGGASTIAASVTCQHIAERTVGLTVLQTGKMRASHAHFEQEGTEATEKGLDGLRSLCFLLFIDFGPFGCGRRPRHGATLRWPHMDGVLA
jgi:hypothetical protein